MEVTNKYIAIKAQVDGAPQESDFEVKTESISLLVKPGSKDIIIKNLYVSIDPYQLNRMKKISASQKTSEFAVGIVPSEVSSQLRSVLKYVSAFVLFPKYIFLITMKLKPLKQFFR